MARIQSNIFKSKFMSTKAVRVWHILRSVHTVLKVKGVPERYYSLDEYADMANCIEFLKNQWIVYYGERGNRNRMVSFAEDKVDEAILLFFQRVFSDTIAAKEAYVAYKDSRFKNVIAVGDFKVSNVKIDVVDGGIYANLEEKEVEPEPEEVKAIMDGRKDRMVNGTISHDDMKWD